MYSAILFIAQLAVIFFLKTMKTALSHTYEYIFIKWMAFGWEVIFKRKYFFSKIKVFSKKGKYKFTKIHKPMSKKS